MVIIVVEGKCKRCSEVRKISSSGVCWKCYSKNRVVKRCSICNKKREVYMDEMCRECYNEKHGIIDVKSEECLMCGKHTIKFAEYCSACYKQLYLKITHCERCNEMKKIHANGMCQSCYNKVDYINRKMTNE